jgi:hypothetical protein
MTETIYRIDAKNLVKKNANMVMNVQNFAMKIVQSVISFLKNIFNVDIIKWSNAFKPTIKTFRISIVSKFLTKHHNTADMIF